LQPVSFDVSYNFTFVSLIAPKLLVNLRINDLRLSSSNTSSKSTILVKQSYLIMTWLYYLTFTSKNPSDDKLIQFSFLPTQRKMYTLTKAPMAHKTNSKEQIVFKFYKFKVSVKALFLPEFSLKSVDQGLLSILQAKTLFPVFSTNMLFLKTYSIQTNISSCNFFNYFFFTKNLKRL
jgi:hypothetical protein